jgi:hypothetical protein
MCVRRNRAARKLKTNRQNYLYFKGGLPILGSPQILEQPAIPGAALNSRSSPQFPEQPSIPEQASFFDEARDDSGHQVLLNDDDDDEYQCQHDAVNESARQHRALLALEIRHGHTRGDVLRRDHLA